MIRKTVLIQVCILSFLQISFKYFPLLHIFFVLEFGTIFGQVSTQILNNFNAKTLRQPSQAWKVKLIGEGADDAGG